MSDISGAANVFAAVAGQREAEVAGLRARITELEAQIATADSHRDKALALLDTWRLAAGNDITDAMRRTCIHDQACDAPSCLKTDDVCRRIHAAAELAATALHAEVAEMRKVPEDLVEVAAMRIFADRYNISADKIDEEWRIACEMSVKYPHATFSADIRMMRQFAGSASSAVAPKLRAAAFEEAARVAEEKMGGYLCPYGRDKPGDPTWDHTDEDECPVCGGDGESSLLKCHDTVAGRIAAAIRALAGATLANGPTNVCPNCGRSKAPDSIGHRHTGAQCYWCGHSTDREGAAP